MNNTYAFFDMDGTIVSFHDRFYRTYSEALLNIGEIPLSKEEWIQLRKNGNRHSAKLDKKIIPFFDKYFESSEYLKYDKIFPKMKKIIQNIQKKYPVKIVSFRANNETLLEQLSNLGIYNVETIIQGYCSGIPCDEKAKMIQKVIPDPKGWIIGDTHYEIAAGKKLGLKTIAVSWGDQSKEYLQTHNPDFLIDNPEEILKIIK